MTIPAFFRAHLPLKLLSRNVIALIAVGLCVWPQTGQALRALHTGDEWLRDLFIVWRASDTPEQRILAVDIDESSLAAQPWPWPRSRLADLVEILLAGGARGVALDILLEKPADAGGDARLAMLATHGPLVLAQLFDYLPRAAPLAAGQLGGGVAAAPGAAAIATGYLGNHAGLAGARHVGNIGVLPDADGVLRRVPLQTWYQGRQYPTLSSALMTCCASQPAAGRSLSQPEYQAQSQAQGQARVPYRRTWAAYDVAKAADVLAGNVPSELIAGRLVLIGSSSLSIGDRVATPLAPSSPGLLVHAAMLGAQLDSQSGQAPAPWPGRALAIGFGLALVALSRYTLARLSAASNAMLLGAAAVLWLGLAWLLAPHDPEFAPAAPLLTILFLLAVAVPYHWQLAQRRSRQLLGTLRQYVAPAVVDELLRSDLQDPLAPRLLEVTTLIADLQGYTSHVEALPPEQAARLTSEFLDCLTRPVLAAHGTLDKYTGDGLVAFWGAPLADPAHADRALDAARQILHEVAAYSARRVAGGLLPLRVRIGIESGPAMAGDYGSSFRSIYTAVGDSVNTASRLEQAARDFPHDVIIGAGTVQRAQRHRFLPLGEHRLRGKEKPVQLYTLATLPEPEREA